MSMYNYRIEVKYHEITKPGKEHKTGWYWHAFTDEPGGGDWVETSKKPYPTQREADKAGWIYLERTYGQEG